MDEEYDFVFLGTGLTECIVASLLVMSGKKVLHMDRNPYYGSDTTSFSPLSKLFEYFGEKYDETDQAYGRGRDWNVDKIPKFLMADGMLVKILIHTNVTRYVDFNVVDGSYIYMKNGIHKVPASDTETIKTGILDLFEKPNFAKFIKWVARYNENDQSSFDGIRPQDTMEMAYEKFKLKERSIELVGHALALQHNDDYLKQPAINTIRRVQLYAKSLSRHGTSPYLYPLYGLGELPQGFARLSAIYGGTHMLDKRIDEIVYDADGKVAGVRSGDEVAKCKAVVCDPSYVPEQCAKVGRVVRAICLLSHTINNTGDAQSCQIIIPKKQVNRQNDIYVALVSSKSHQVTANSWYLAICSTVVETDDPNSELNVALNLLKPIRKSFIQVSDLMVPKHDGRENHVYISKSYDATSHFESTCEDIVDLHKRIVGHDIDLESNPRGREQEDDEEEH